MVVDVDLAGGAALPDELRSALRSRIAGELQLPLLPATAARIMAACHDERAKVADLANLVLQDASLAAYVLRTANSAAYAARIPILSLPQAIGRVGLGTVSNIAVAVALKERVFSVPGSEARLSSLWRHAVVTAHYAKEVAEHLRLDVESAFLCGLLHDVGMPIVLQLVVELERQGLAAHPTDALLEAVLTEFHAEAGTRLVETWKLGPWVGAVIRHHHDPASATLRLAEIRVIALADALADWAVEEGKKAEDFADDRNRDGLLGLREGGLSSLLRRRAAVLQAVEALA